MDKNEAGHLFLRKTTVATSDGLGTTLTALVIFYLWHSGLTNFGMQIRCINEPFRLKTTCESDISH